MAKTDELLDRAAELRERAMKRVSAYLAAQDQPQAEPPGLYVCKHGSRFHPCPECTTPAAEPDVERHIRDAVGRMARFDIPLASAIRAALRTYGEECRAAERAKLRKWLNNNTTFYNTAESERPALASVAKRIWYHATDDTENYPFSAVVDAAIRETRHD